MKKNKLFIITSDITKETPYVIATTKQEAIQEFIANYTELSLSGWKMQASSTHEDTFHIEYECWIPDFRRFQNVTRFIKIMQLPTM
jgi:hypothetical protein